MNPTHPNLHALAAAFSAWRAERPHRSTPVPELLRRKAVALLELCPRSHIIKALGINSAMLKAWQHSGRSPAAFVALNLPPEPASGQSEPEALTLRNRAGQQVTLQGEFSAAQLALLARALTGNTQEPTP
jgi:hypothetical protein